MNWLIIDAGAFVPLLGPTHGPAGWSSRRSATSGPTSIMRSCLLPFFLLLGPLVDRRKACCFVVGYFALRRRPLGLSRLLPLCACVVALIASCCLFLLALF